MHRRALTSTVEIVAAIDVEQYGLPTPCPAFEVRDLIAHLVSGNKRWIAMAHGEPATAVPLVTDLDDADAVAAYRNSCDEVTAAWADPALLDKLVQLPFAEVPGRAALGIHTVEQVAHGWDLAKATGQPTEIAPELYAVAWEFTKDIDDAFRVPSGPFGPAVTPPANASDTERLVAWLGRSPSWS
jgi:uncharacterized protein (TIGR03086 family)